MNPDTARLVFVSIMAAGFIVWLWSLIMASRLGRSASDADRLTFDEGPALRTETGEVTVSGDSESLSKALVRALRQPGIGMFGALFKVTERSPERVVLEKTGPVICNQPAALYFTEAELNFAPLGGGKVRVSYRLGYKRLVFLLRKVALSIIFAIGLPVMLLVGTLIWFLVVRNENPAVRWQVFQTLHIFHALWPPFLFLAFYSIGRRRSRVFIENLITSAEVDEV